MSGHHTELHCYLVGYDMFVQRFEHGNAALMEGEAFRAVFEPHVDRRDPDGSYWHISTDDGSTADIYATVDCVTISRFSPGLVLDLLVKFIGLADAVVLPPGCPTLLAHEGRRRHLPEELAADAVVVHAVSDVERVLQSC